MRVTNAKRHGGLELKMTPMIDVVFLLLVFFLWTSSFNEPEFDLPSSFAAAPETAAVARGTSEQTPELFDEIVIEVTPITMQLNGQPQADLTRLRQSLEAIADISTEASVIIDPSADTEMARAIAVYDASRAAGFSKVLFAAKK